MDLHSISEVVRTVDVDVFSGYPATGARLPHVVVRPMILDPEAITLDGMATVWDFQYTAYAVAGSVDASFKLAQDVIQAVQGKGVGDSTLSASMGYVGAAVEGRYESQITIQTHQGGLS